MINFSQILAPFLPLYIVIFIVIGLAFAVKIFLLTRKDEEKDEQINPYEKKTFVFDAMNELSLYRQLIELFGDKYYIFPQIPYARLIKVKNGMESYNRNRFDKKIADFVLCNKEQAVAKLVIELDGSSHQAEKRIERDNKVDAMMQQIGLPILHLKVGSFDKDKLKNEVLNKLSNIDS